MNNKIPALLKTEETRVWRTYTGGAALDSWHGRNGENSHFPEDWAASTTQAKNYGREEIMEGLSRVVNMEGKPYLADVAAASPQAVFGKRHVEAFGNSAAFLVKLIDAAERLGIQVHPDKRYAKEVLNSDYGKAESWYILGANAPEAEPYIYLGFRPGITREHWKKLFDEQDIPGMLECLHRIPVHAGEVFYIAGGLPHAIGDGCFLAEVQEPTDYTMRVERTTPNGLKIKDMQCHLGVGFDKMLDCFHYEGADLEETRKLWQSQPVCVCKEEGGVIHSLIDERQTKLFSMRSVDVTGSFCLKNEREGMSILIVLSGSGSIEADGETMALRQGDVVVMTASCVEVVVKNAGETLSILQSFPPKA